MEYKVVLNKKYATVREAAEKFIEYSDNRTKKTPKPLLAISNFFEYSLADSFTYGNKLGEVMSSLIDSI